MPTKRWQRVQELYTEALARKPDERASFLADACGADAELRAEVASLVDHERQVPADFMKPPEPQAALLYAQRQGSACANPERLRLSDRPDPLIGGLVGRYHVKSVIASGGMGTVYEAVQEQPHRIVALKVMKRNVASRSALRRFQFESQVLGHLHHPNVAQVYEAGLHRGKHGEVPYFAMEYILGAKSILEFAGEKGLAVPNRMRLFAKVCDAVHHGHQKGVVHRDLKPANILVDSSGEPKVIDFGVARGTDSDLSLTTQHTDVGQLIGTMQYMSPEQCDADPHDLDTRSDVYSLGVVLFELLTGELPYRASGSTIYQATRIIKEDVPRKLSSINPKLRGDVETIVLRALEKDRDKRYQSAADLARDIHHYLNREPVEASPPSIRTRIATWIIRHPVATSLAASAVVVLLMLSSGMLAQWLVFRRPHSVLVTPDQQRVHLLSVSGNLLDKMPQSNDGPVVLCKIIPPSEVPSGRTLAIVGFSRFAASRWEGRLCAFDVSDGTFGDPLWQTRVRSSEVPPESEQRSGFSGRDFGPQLLLGIEDIFPERPGPELVVTFAHAYSRRSLRIYSLEGDVLYEVWHDGGIRSAEWLEAAGLLVLSGENAEGYWKDRGVQRIKERHPWVVFAIRPKLGRRHCAYIRSEQTTESVKAVWYKGVLPPRASDVFQLPPMAPRDVMEYRDGYHFFLAMTYSADPTATFNWIINSAGEIVSAVKGDAYARNPDLPSMETFRLGPLPPITD